MKNRLVDLNDHLFTQLERLTDEDLTDEEIGLEVKRADAIVSVSEQIIRNADLSFKAANLVANHGDRFKPMLPQVFRQPAMIEGTAEPSDDGDQK